MKLSIASSAALLLLTFAALAQTNDELFAALNNVQHEMSRCIAYYTILQGCIETSDAALAAETSKVTEHLVGFSAQLGNTIGLTEDSCAIRCYVLPGSWRLCSILVQLSARQTEIEFSIQR